MSCRLPSSLLFAALLCAGLELLRAAPPAPQPGARHAGDDFRNGLGQWCVEQQPGGTVTAADGQLVITDTGGCTVWFRPQLRAPLVITYTATVAATPRVSDLNCFWMATDPARPGHLLAAGHRRDGRFATYDTLRTYYVGCGGNGNTTTRFRRYDGKGARPLLPEHDRQDSAALLQAEHPYRIQLTVTAEGRVQFIRDGVVLFDYLDPQPLREGWFGFRTVNSRLEIRDFAVSSPNPEDVSLRVETPGR